MPGSPKRAHILAGNNSQADDELWEVTGLVQDLIAVYEDVANGRRRKASQRITRAIGPGLRFQVLQRDGFQCIYCGRKASAVELHVDHVVPWSRGGRTTMENLRTACSDCNLGKGASTASI